MDIKRLWLSVLQVVNPLTHHLILNDIYGKVRFELQNFQLAV